MLNYLSNKDKAGHDITVPDFHLKPCVINLYLIFKTFLVFEIYFVPYKLLKQNENKNHCKDSLT